ncbi:MAG: T9SS type A sorting domain-containing protein [Bacteroidetes bacterium]|jgi:hypothetical protein|nr:T9SS type A sorting domain-containing protein [Bacteroidota bacterium]
MSPLISRLTNTTALPGGPAYALYVTGLALAGLLLLLPRTSIAQPVTYACGGEGEAPCAIDTEFFWSNGNFFCDRGLKATGFNVLPDISFNLNDAVDFNQADLSQIAQLINTDWPTLQSRLRTLDESDFLYQQCTGIEQDGACWTVPPTPAVKVSGKEFGGTCVPTGDLESCTIWNPFGDDVSGYKDPVLGACIPTGDLTSCEVTIPATPGVPAPYIWLPDPSASGWQLPLHLATFISQVDAAVAALPGDLGVALPPPPDPTGILAFEDLATDFAAPPGTCVNETRHQPTATAVQESWTYWALTNQRELAKQEPLNWVTQVYTHNAYNSAADGYPFPNHEYSMTDQLRMGARVLALDVHWHNSRMRLCHGQPDQFGCADLDRFVDGALKELADWLTANPDEVVIIDLEDYLYDRESTFDHLLATYLGDVVYRGADLPAHLAGGPSTSNVRGTVNGNMVTATRWPTLQEMRAMNKQVIIVGNNTSEWTWHGSATGGGKASHLPLAADGGLDGCLLGEGLYDTPIDLSTPGDKFISVYEARSLLDPFAFPGLLNRMMVADLATCGASYVGLDMLQATETTADNICNAERDRVLEATGNSALAAIAFEECASSHRRLTSFVWSWGPGDRGQNGSYAALSMGDGRWHSTSTGNYHYACASPRTGDPASWPAPHEETWRVTEAAGPWDEGEETCIREFGDQGLVFVVPVNGRQNEQLRAAANTAGLGNGDAVWLDYRRLSTDTWLPGNEAAFTGPAHTVAGDLTGDGPTALISNWGGTEFNRVRTFTPDGGDAFVQQHTQLHPVQPVDWTSHTLYTGDFNGDGRTDLLWNDVWNNYGTFYVGLAQPDGRFDFATSAHAIPLSEYTDWLVHPADVDGDGATDLLAVSSSATPGLMRVGRSNGDGTFTFGDVQIHSNVLREGQEQFRRYEALVGDVTGDGRADVVWNARAGVASVRNRTYVSQGQGDGTFASGNAQDHPVNLTDWRAYSPLLADVDGDGTDDLIWNRRGGGANTLYVASTTGTGGFTFSTDPQVHPANASWRDFDLHVGDLNGDDRADLVWNRRTPTENVWYLGVGQADGTVQLSAPRQQHAEERDWTTFSLHLADLDGDGSGALVWHDPNAAVTTHVWIPPRAVLPVELTRFTATADQADVVLQWSTASETNNAGFEIQAAPTDDPAAGWNAVAFIEGAGTTSEPRQYRHRVSTLGFGAYRFRLKQVDTDGTTHYSEEVELTVALDQAVLVSAPYPNPARAVVTLDMTVRETQHVSVDAYDVLGRRVATIYHGRLPANRTERLRLEGHRLPSGLYFVRAVGDDFSITRRVTLVR